MTTPPPPYGPPQQPYGGPVQPPLSPSDEKLWAVLTHLGGLVFWFLAPLVTYLILKDRGPFVRAHTATALNFQITITLALIVSAMLSVVGIGVLLFLAVGIIDLVFAIIAAVKAGNGEWYRYPVAITFVR